MSSRRARALLWTLGGTLTIVSIAVGVEIVMQLDDRVTTMVRTPSGCSSEVEFSDSGRFYLYLETDGVIGDLGPCGNDERLYSIDGDPSAEVLITDDSGAEVDLRDDDSVEYDNGTFAGRSVAWFSASAGDRYVITVAGDREVVIAAGRNVAPEAQAGFIVAALMMLAGITVLVVALVTTIGSRRRSRRTPVVLNYADGTTTWAPPSPEDGVFRDDATR